jgi:hypothetical protein
MSPANERPVSNYNWVKLPGMLRDGKAQNLIRANFNQKHQTPPLSALKFQRILEFIIFWRKINYFVIQVEQNSNCANLTTRTPDNTAWNIWPKNAAFNQ